MAERCLSCGGEVGAAQRFCQECGTRLTAQDAGEHKVITAIFCDIVGSTSLAEQIGGEEMHELLDRFFRLAGEALGRYGGTINKYLGDGFLALVGVPVAHEDHARRAVLAALDLQERIAAEWPEGAEPRVRARIGVNTGSVVIGQLGAGAEVDFTAIGDTTNVAARLESLAAPGTVLISAATEEAVRGYIACQDAGDLSLRGRAGTVNAFVAVCRGDRRSPLERSDRRLSQFVGRRRQLTALGELLDEARNLRGQVVGVVAEPGMGKSRLIATFLESLGHAARVREGRCLSFGSGIPYVPIADLVRAQAGLVGIADPDEVAVRLHERCGQLGLRPQEQVPYLANMIGLRAGADALRDRSPEAIRNATFETLLAVCMAEAGEALTVYVIEDLHWIDPVSQDFLAFLVERIQGQRIILLCTYRPGYQAPWMQLSYATQLALPRLGPDESRELVGSVVAAGTVADEVVDTVVARADGNPFFIEELSRALAGGAQELGAVPATVHDVLLARIDELDEEPRRLLRAAAVLGREFTRPVLAEVWSGSSAIDPLLDELTRREFIYLEHRGGEQTYAFKHALTQDVADSGLLTSRRRELHRRAGVALERFFEDRLEEVYDRLGHHFSEARAHREAVHYLSLAAERASQSYSNATAADALERALGHIDELDDPDTDRRALELVFRLAFTYYLLGRFRPALELMEAHGGRLESAGAASYRGEHHFWLAFFHTHLGNSGEALRHAHRAIDEANRTGDRSTSGRAHYVLTREDFWACRYVQGVARGQRAVELFDGPDDWWWLGHASAWKGLNHLHAGHFEEALEECGRMNAIGSSRSDPRLQSYSDWNLGWIEATRGNSSAGISYGTRSLQQSPDLLNSAYSTAWLGFAYREEGDYPRAISHLERSIASLREFGYTRLVGWFSVWLAEAYLWSGRPVDARKTTEEGLEISRSVAYPWAIALGTRALGRVLDTEGRFDEARVRLEEALEEFVAIDSRFDAAVTRLDLARVCAATGHHKTAIGEALTAEAAFRSMAAPAYLERARELASALPAAATEQPRR